MAGSLVSLVNRPEESDVPRTIVNPAGLHDPVGFGYSHTASAPGRNLVFIGGQYGSDEHGQVVSASFTEQVTRSFLNLDIALEAVGLDFSHVVQVGLHVVDHDAEKLAIVVEHLRKTWGAEPPAATLRGVAALALPDMLFEIDAIAVSP
jgi:enamine deaminase RidA (YjgF/YER057c/UK114 family)